METYILDIQRNSIHDGPGVRTAVFLKGCPLCCSWCHNPESQGYSRELSYREHQCTNCGMCESVCIKNVHTVNGSSHHVKREECNSCGACVKACPAKALSLVGDIKDVQQVYHIVEKDRSFYESSNGGVTISGGEPLIHSKYVKELLQLCKLGDIHTCIETSGFV